MGETLVKLNEAERALACAEDAFETMELEAIGKAAEVYAIEHGAMEHAIRAALFRLKARRKTTKLIKPEIRIGNPNFYPNGNSVVTLADYGFTKMDWKRRRQEHEVADENFLEFCDECVEKTILPTPAGLRRFGKEIERKERIAEDLRASQNLPDCGFLWQLYQKDINDFEIEARSVDAIITDPPYPEKFLPLYESLGILANHALKDGCSLLALVGQAHLPSVFNLLVPHLNYHWAMALMLQGQKAPMYQRKVINGWKPILWFTKGKYEKPMIGDVVWGSGREKELHKWQQGVGGFEELIKKFTRPGELVLDPFCGTGTTGVAAVRLGRRFIGLDIEEERIASAKVRLEKINTL